MKEDMHTAVKTTYIYTYLCAFLHVINLPTAWILPTTHPEKTDCIVDFHLLNPRSCPKISGCWWRKWRLSQKVVILKALQRMSGHQDIYVIICNLSKVVQDIFNQYQGTVYPGTALILNHHRRLGPLVLTTRVPDGNDHLSVHKGNSSCKKKVVWTVDSVSVSICRQQTI